MKRGNTLTNWNEAGNLYNQLNDLNFTTDAFLFGEVDETRRVRSMAPCFKAHEENYKR